MPNRNFLAAVGSVAAAFIIVLSLAFKIQESAPSIPDDVFGAIAALSIVGISFGLFAVLATPGTFRRRRAAPTYLDREGPVAPPPPPVPQLKTDADRRRDAYVEYSQRRIAQLAADPARRKYADLMKAGPHWSDEQIAYDQDPHLTATCPHLKPIEQAIRSAGIDARLMTASFEQRFAPLARVQADCRVNVDELKRQFPLPASVAYTEGYQPERSQYDNPWARLACSDCRSAIELVHPEWPRRTTQWFPAAP